MVKFVFMLFVLSVVLSADIIDYYKNILDHLKYSKMYSLYKRANNISQDALGYSRYANFSFDISYRDTKADMLNSAFEVTDVAFNDTLDIFGKSSYEIEELVLDLKEQKSSLNLKKEKLFVLLIKMLALYHKTDEKLSLHKSLLDEQQEIYEKLRSLNERGSVTYIDRLRFKNALTSLKTKIIDENSKLMKMRKQLHLYAPNMDIPALERVKLLYSKDDFLAHNPEEELNKIDVNRFHVKAEKFSHIYLPDIRTEVAYQRLGDPTAYGDNYSFSISLNMSINSGDFKQSESFRVHALSQKARTKEYKLKRENEYIQRYEDYKSAKKQLDILEDALSEYIKSDTIIKRAYLKQYVDFNAYLQVLSQSIHVKEKIIDMNYQLRLEVNILNAISSGEIYEII